MCNLGEHLITTGDSTTIPQCIPVNGVSSRFLYISSFKVQSSGQEHLTDRAWYLAQWSEARRKKLAPLAFVVEVRPGFMGCLLPWIGWVLCWAARTAVNQPLGPPVEMRLLAAWKPVPEPSVGFLPEGPEELARGHYDVWQLMMGASEGPGADSPQARREWILLQSENLG